MAVSPIFAASLAEEVARIYEEAELRILERLVALLTKGMDGDADWWERDVLERLQTLRPQVLAILREVNPAAAAQITATLEEAYGAGMLSAYREVGSQSVPVAHTAAVEALAAATLGKTVEAAPFILRAAEDAVRGVVAEVLRGTTTGTLLKRDALQRALNGLVREGFATVPVGRRTMGAADYARLAVRTGTAQAMIAGHVQGMQDLGLDLVTITPGPRACKVCDEWAGMVLSSSGRTPAGVQEAEGLGAQDVVRVKVDGTLDEARAAGCFHPNCRCAIRAFLPGITKRRDVTDRPAWDEKGYHAQQQQRAIERDIRRAKERLAVAVTPEARRDATRAIKSGQARMRQHIADNPFLKRQSAREQVLRPDAPTPTKATPKPTPTRPSSSVEPRPVPSSLRDARDPVVSRTNYEVVHRSVTSRLDDAQAEALRRYVDTSHEPINRALRNGDPLPDRYVETVRNLDSIFESGKARKVAGDRIAYRGADGLGGIPVGQAAVDRGFSSATLDPELASEFGQPFKVVMPSGSQWVPGHLEEVELVLPRGTIYQRISEGTFVAFPPTA